MVTRQLKTGRAQDRESSPAKDRHSTFYRCATWGYGFQRCLSVCLCVCLSVFPHDRYTKSASARITKLGIQMFHYECWKLIYFGKGTKGQTWRSWATKCRRGCLHFCECRLLLIIIRIIMMRFIRYEYSKTSKTGTIQCSPIQCNKIANSCI